MFFCFLILSIFLLIEFIWKVDRKPLFLRIFSFFSSKVFILFWSSIERLYKIDLAIIILAVIEVNYVKETPKQVVINEAVELAKKFSTDKSPKFINGILADILE